MRRRHYPASLEGRDLDQPNRDPGLDGAAQIPERHAQDGGDALRLHHIHVDAAAPRHGVEEDFFEVIMKRMVQA
jgi:hypothetical protein